jgi:hypothetical protein
MSEQQLLADSLAGSSLQQRVIIRVKAYWCTLGVSDQEQLNLLSERAMQRVLNRTHEITEQNLPYRALEEIQRMLDEWLTDALPRDLCPIPPGSARVALLDGLVPDWPTQLAAHSHRPETISNLFRALPEPVPPVNGLAMPLQTIRLFSLRHLVALCHRLFRWSGNSLKQRLTRTGKSR